MSVHSINYRMPVIEMELALIGRELHLRYLEFRMLEFLFSRPLHRPCHWNPKRRVVPAKENLAPTKWKITQKSDTGTYTFTY